MRWAWTAGVLLVAGAALAADTTYLAVKIGGMAPNYPAACRLTRARAVGARTEHWIPSLPCMPIIGCPGSPLAYRYEARAGSSKDLPFCPSEVVGGPWR